MLANQLASFTNILRTEGSSQTCCALVNNCWGVTISGRANLYVYVRILGYISFVLLALSQPVEELKIKNR